jgi:hypothetical protein
VKDAVMRIRTKQGRTLGVALWLLCATAGCTVSVQPWTKQHAPATPDGAAAAATGPGGFKAPIGPFPPNNANGAPGSFGPNGFSPNGYSPAGYGQGPYPQNQGQANESAAQLIKQLNDLDDQRRALQDQVQALKKQARDRDENLQHASFEMDESTKQIKRTREEVRQFSAELDDLRERMRKLEEMRTALKPLIEEIMFHLEREKDAAKSQRSLTKTADNK